MSFFYLSLPTAPSFPVSINVSVEKLNPALIDFEKIFNFATNSIKEVERTGFFGWIADIFTTKTVVDIDEFKRNIVAEIKRLGHAELDRNIAALKEISAHFQSYFRIWSDIRVEDE